MAPTLVVVALVSIWVAVSVLPPVLRRRRRPTGQPTAVSPVNEVVVHRAAWHRYFVPTLMLLFVVIGVALTVSGQWLPALVVIPLLIVGLPQIPSLITNTPLLIADKTGLEVSRQGRLSWDQIAGVLVYSTGNSQFAAIVAAPGAPKPRTSPMTRLSGWFESRMIGYQRWGGFSSAWMTPFDWQTVLGLLRSNNVTFLEPRRRR